MVRRAIGRGGRAAALAFVVALVFAVVGDRGRAATGSSVINGQDPLEVLSLKIRPNVFIVLDSSGSMTSNVTESTNTRSGDHPRSKMYQAKQVMRTVVQQNQEKASFLFGTYTQLDEISGSYNSLQPNNMNEGANRFQYSADDDAYPNLATTDLRVRTVPGDSNDRGFQSWQIIDAQWNTLYFDEDSNTSGATTASCAAVIPGPYPRFFQTGDALAAALQAAMNAAGCAGQQNTYNVSYSGSSGRFTFSRASGTRNWRIVWGASPNNIRNALAETSTGTTGYQTTGSISTDAPWTLLFRDGTGTSGTGMNTDYRFSEEIPRGSGNFVQFYQLRAGRLWNGEIIKVQADGTVCDIVFPAAAAMTSPPSITLQLVQNGCGTDVAGERAVFTFAGAAFGGNNRNCRGFQPTVALIPCDLQSPPAPLQVTTIGPFLEPEIRFNPDGSPRDYSEVMDGGWDGQYARPPIFTDSAKATGNTPIANTLIDILGLAENGGSNCFDPTDGTTANCAQRGFDKLWNVGQAGSTTAAGSPPYQLDPIRNHLDPKEKTIVLFVTDGDDTCYNRGDSGSSSNMDDNARRAAFWAEKLYARKVATDPASSVETFVIGFGGGTPYRLDWIAWGGSGLGQGLPGQPQINVQSGSDAYPPDPQDEDVRWNGNDSYFRGQRANCTTCRDAFIAPDADTLAATLQAIIDQGAQIGEFSSQQSLTQSVFEYADVGGADAAWPQIRPGEGRYEVLVPTRIVSTFSLPGFNGQLRAYQSDGATPPSSVLKWSAGDVLQTQVASGMTAACDTSSVGGSLGLCGFGQLHAGATDTGIWNSAAAIKRRVYTTDRNGVYTYDPTSLMAGTANSRVTLWPPDPAVAPNSYTAMGSLDTELGLPTDTPTCTLVAPYTSCAQQELARLKADFNACVGSNLPGACTGGGTTSQMQAARREAREMILAFMAGAKAVINTGTAGVARTSGAVSGVPANSVLYQVRNWILADSQLATPAILGPPAQQEPEATTYRDEYLLFRDGVRNASGTNPDSAGSQLYQGFGLRHPDSDGTVTTPDTPDTRIGLKPAMTVIYAPANDMLHAFRAGPNCSPDLGSCVDSGGEELWGFVPYDQLSALPSRVVNDPQGRDNHVYMLARGVRFADIFVPELPGPLTNVGIGGVTVSSMQGVWRRILFFGRGIGGKYVTALDVTGVGPYTQRALRTGGPIPLWSRGNPDSPDGVASNPVNNGTSLDRAAYTRMGETWSLPSVAFIDRSSLLYQTARRPDGVEFVLFMGSGYGGPGEGSTFYTLDALSGDVIGAADVDLAAGNNGLTRTGLTYPSSIVANVVGFNPSGFPILQGFHPANDYVRRVYFGDTHGRLWKVLTSDPDVAIPIADLGEDQPVGTAASLLGLPPSVSPPPNTNVIPHIFVSSGNDSRADGPFANFAFRDDGTDFDTSVGTGVTTVTTDGVTVTAFPPAVTLFARFFDQGTPDADCGYTEEAVFRGTVQPATTFECETITGGLCNNPLGRVFFAGTRLSLPNTVFAPPTPFACGIGDYPCRSQFDSILYALGAETGQAAYDLNASGDDAYRIIRDSRIAAIGMQADPDPTRGGASFAADEGLVKGTPAPPPPAGLPPTSTTATASVLMTRDPGQPPPAVRYGSTVCQ